MVPSFGYKQKPPICRNAVTIVCTAILQHVLRALCAATKGIGPTNEALKVVCIEVQL